MTVIKKSGQIQAFKVDKMRLSIENASDECKAPMTGSDINLVVKDVLTSIRARNLEQQINTHTIRELILASLEKFGFTLVAKHYREN